MGRRKQIDIPNTASRGVMPAILGNPFNRARMIREVFDNKIKKLGSSKEEHAMKGRLRDSHRVKAKYLLYVLYIGKCLQHSLTRLENERVLDVEEVEKYVTITDHPVFSTNLVSHHRTSALTDEMYFLWAHSLEDYLLLVTSHLEEIIAAMYDTNYPNYLDLPILGSKS